MQPARWLRFTADYYNIKITDRIVLTENLGAAGSGTAAVNAAVLAIVDAGIPMQDTMACCSAGYLDDTPLLDLNYMEVRDPSSPQMPRQIPSVRLFFSHH